MRDYAELAKALRICGNRDSDCEGCPLRGKYDFNDCAFAVDVKAADAIEELVAELNSANECYTALSSCFPHWISVEERLPDEDMEVLISYRYKEGEGDTNHVNIDITTYGQMYFGGREVEGVKHWRPPFEYFSSNYEVVAWMPLPKPPKEVLPNGDV